MNENVTVLALTGPPAAGKSTVVNVLKDLGVPCKDTGELIREEAQRRYNGGAGEPDEDYIWNVAELVREEHGPAGPTILAEDWIEEKSENNDLICIASLRDQEEVDFLRESVGPTLVIRIDANVHARSDRYVESKLGGEDKHVVDKERVRELQHELRERELRESPYPRHDLQIRNENSVSMRELWEKLDNVIHVLQESSG